jgi:hypothetical protein
MFVERTMEYAELRLRSTLAKLPAGQYTIEYTDSTHTQEGEWRSLLEVTVETSPLGTGEDLLHPYYSVRAAQQKAPAEPDKEKKDAADRGKARAKDTAELQEQRILRDQLGQALVRCGLLRPELASEEAADLLQLSKAQAVVLLPDTNALFNGTLHWLARALGRPQLWIQPVSVSLAQVQQRDASLKAMAWKNKPGNLPQALRSRVFVNATLGLLERLGSRYQVLEVSPELLRYVRTSVKEGSDPDQGDVLEDRLLLEAVHVAWRSTRSRAEKRVITSDVLFARVLHAEGLTPLFLQPPLLSDESVACVRFEPLAQRFEGSPLPLLLWDLAHTFSTVRLRREGEEQAVAQFATYWPRKGFQDWTRERLQVALRVPQDAKSATIQAPAAQLVPSAKPLPESPAERPQPRKRGRPRFLDILHLGGHLQSGPKHMTELIARLPHLSESAIGEAARVLQQAGLAQSHDENTLGPRLRLLEFDKALRMNDLDEASHLLERLEPYQVTLRWLRDLRVLSRPSAPDELQSQLRGFSYPLLIESALQLGQAFIDGLNIHDGSQRLPTAFITGVFKAQFEEFEKQGLVPVGRLLPELCRVLSMSPWALKRQLEQAVSLGILNDYMFEPAASPGRVAPENMVVAGGLREAQLEPVSSGFMLIGGRPVFTVSRRSQS